MTADSAFLYATCQLGAENPAKLEIQRLWPALRFAFSRPAFLTFRGPAELLHAPDFELGAVFARSWGLALGPVTGSDDPQRAIDFWRRQESHGPVSTLHVWSREATAAPTVSTAPEPVDDGLVPLRRTADLLAAAHPGNPFTVLGPSGLAGAVAASEAAATESSDSPLGLHTADAIVIEPGTWWAGRHARRGIETTWPGGLFPETPPEWAVSRGWLKMREALAWSGLPLQPGSRCVEVGCAPGGASQALLERGVDVLGVDPAEVHPDVLGHPRFRHLRQRAKEVRRRVFVGADWLMVDINLPPSYALDVVEGALSYPGVRPRGLLLTLKLREWSLAARVPRYLERIGGWGFAKVRARQLSHNRREFCVAASR